MSILYSLGREEIGLDRVQYRLDSPHDKVGVTILLIVVNTAEKCF